MAKDSDANVKTTSIQEINYRKCRHCGNKVHDRIEIVSRNSRVLERNPVVTNFGCGDKSNCKYS